MKAFLAALLCLMVAAAPDSYTYADSGSGLRKLGKAPKFNIDYQRGIASCYGSEYYYYKGWRCTNCNEEQEEAKCPKVDPLDKTAEELQAAREKFLLISIAVVLGSCVLCAILTVCCGAYYGSQYAMEWRAK